MLTIGKSVFRSIFLRHRDTTRYVDVDGVAREYLVKWANWSHVNDTWENELTLKKST